MHLFLHCKSISCFEQLLDGKLCISLHEFISQYNMCGLVGIRKKYPKIKWIQSFADERCKGFGIVYQACSFDYYGEHLSTFFSDGEKYYHNIQVTASRDKAGIQVKEKSKLKKIKLRQFRYIKFIDRREKKNCLLKQKPYLKHYNND